MVLTCHSAQLLETYQDRAGGLGLLGAAWLRTALAVEG